MSATWERWTNTWVTHFNRAALAAIFLVGATVTAAAAASLVPAANAVIDQAQVSVVEWIVGGAVAAFFAFLGFLGRKIGIKVVEHFNRAAISAAAENFGNLVIDDLQARYLAQDIPDLSDLVARGLTYVHGGSNDAISESKIANSRLKTIIEGQLKHKGIAAATAVVTAAAAAGSADLSAGSSTQARVPVAP